MHQSRSLISLAAATPIACATLVSSSAAQSSFVNNDYISDPPGRLMLPVPNQVVSAGRLPKARVSGGLVNRQFIPENPAIAKNFPDSMQDGPTFARGGSSPRVGLEIFSSRNYEFEVRGGEVLAINMAPDPRHAAEEKGFEVLRSTQLESVGVSLYVLRPPKGMSIERALKKLRKADPNGFYEPNSIFDGAGVATSSMQLAVAARAGTARLGLIDTGVFTNKSAFSLSKISQRNFGRGANITPRDHGTYIAMLSVQYGVGELLVADAFSGKGEFTDAESLARALNWLAKENVAVINMSLAGPPSKLLEITVARLIQQGHTIVAAVGNDGPDTAPQYPAAYPSVIGVTAIDEQLNIYEKANRGVEVDVAFIGVNILEASEGHETLSGTSFATPAIAAFLAHNIDRPEPGAAFRMGNLVESLAIDLGAPGRDPIFGAGYLSLQPARRPTYGPIRSD